MDPLEGRGKCSSCSFESAFVSLPPLDCMFFFFFLFSFSFLFVVRCSLFLKKLIIFGALIGLVLLGYGSIKPGPLFLCLGPFLLCVLVLLLLLLLLFFFFLFFCFVLFCFVLFFCPSRSPTSFTTEVHLDDGTHELLFCVVVSHKRRIHYRI